MERVIVLGGAGDAFVIFIDANGHVHVVHPSPPDELQVLVRTFEAAVRIEDRGVFEKVSETLGHAINAQVGRVFEGASV